MIRKKKKELRLKISQQSAKISLKEKQAQSDEVFKTIEGLEQFRDAGTIALFWSLWDELPTHDMVKKWSSGEKQIVLPRVSGDTMDFVKYTPECNMEEGSLGVLVPKEGETVDPEEIDLIIVPGVAFDKEGRRLGRGKGFYDNFVERTQAFRIGVCMNHQKVDVIPYEEHDKKVDMLVTPEIN